MTLTSLLPRCLRGKRTLQNEQRIARILFDIQLSFLRKNKKKTASAIAFVAPSVFAELSAGEKKIKASRMRGKATKEQKLYLSP